MRDSLAPRARAARAPATRAGPGRLAILVTRGADRARGRRRADPRLRLPQRSCHHRAAAVPERAVSGRPEVRDHGSNRHHVGHQHRRSGSRGRTLRGLAHGGVLDRERVSAGAGDGAGADRADPPAPVGEYAQSCLGRERVVEHVSREDGLRALMFRLNYAVDLRVRHAGRHRPQGKRGEPIDLGVGYFNAIWQGDANSYALRSLELCASPPAVLNVTGPSASRPANARSGSVLRKGTPLRQRGGQTGAAQRLDPLPHAARRAAGALAGVSGSPTGSATAAAR